MAPGTRTPSHRARRPPSRPSPVINGSAVAGQTLSPSGGAWRSPNPEASRTEVWWEWWRCPSTDPDEIWRCRFQSRNTNYVVTAGDVGSFLYLVRYVRWRDTKGTSQTDDDTYTTRLAGEQPHRAGDQPAPAAAAHAHADAHADADARAAPTAPAPTFDTAAAAPTPVPTSGEVLQQTATKRRVIRPFPVVRMRGRLTATGARVSLLSVRAPRAAKVFVHCKGSCPSRRWSRTARKSRLTRVSTFERSLRAGTRITITVSRRGYVGKRTTFVIRRGLAPLRTDRCLNSKGRVTRCPAGV